jgi:hypothetical protein
MPRRRGSLTAAGAMLLVAATVGAQPPRQSDAVVFENEYIRARIHTLNTVEHFHSSADVPQVIYCLGSVTVWRDDGSTGECARDQVLFLASGWVDLKAERDARPEVLIAEIKQPAGDVFVDRRDAATKVAPEVYRLLLDNDVVQVTKIDIRPGQRTAMHWHAGNDFRYPLTSARTRYTFVDGSAQQVESLARIPRWTADASEHILENIGSTEALTVLIEVK